SSAYSIETRTLVSTPKSLTLQPGEGYWVTNTITLPEMQSGRYILAFWVDPVSALYDSDRDNNVGSAEVDFLLTAPSPPVIVPGAFAANGQFQLSVYGSFGTWYAVQVSTNLTDWQSSSIFTCTDSPTVIYDSQASASASKFYRIVTPPPGLPTQPGPGPPPPPPPVTVPGRSSPQGVQR
ncbi:MAG TPA: hypothetical protein VL793_00515, partial [Patescibacteria group bacterium]|nr:hypothetical protein [Patescibacteria group bacterium]